MGYALLTGLLCDEIESIAQHSSQEKNKLSITTAMCLI